MRILMINKFLYPKGGAETYYLKLGEYLNAHGHEVQYFGMDDEKRTVGNRAQAYTSNLDFHGGSSRLQKLTYPFRIIYSTEARRKIRLVLDDFQPDVVHLNNFNFQITPSVIVEIVKWRQETGRKCRIIFTAHDVNLVCPNHLMKNPITGEICEKCVGGRFINCTRGKCIHGSTLRSMIGTAEGYFWNKKGTYRYIDEIICCSAFLKTKMDTNPVFAEKTVALHNFIDKTPWQEPHKKEYVLYFGRYSDEKGIDTLIKVCRMLPDIPFVFVGSGPLADKLTDAPNIVDKGFNTGAALEKYIREARFSLYPSEWYENCPFSVMESIQYGTPVIGADIGGIPELIDDGVTGELFESRNAEALKEKIESLWNDRERNNRYIMNCRDNSFDTIDRYCEKLIRIYNPDGGAAADTI